jgi:hypothetical protein
MPPKIHELIKQLKQAGFIERGGRGSHRNSRDSELATIPFYISSSGRLCRPFNHKILSVALLRLRFCSIRDDKSSLNLSVKLGTSANSKSLTHPCCQLPITISGGAGDDAKLYQVRQVQAALEEIKHETK